MVKLTLTNKKANTAIKFRKLCFEVLDDHGKSYIFYLLYDPGLYRGAKVSWISVVKAIMTHLARGESVHIQKASGLIGIKD